MRRGKGKWIDRKGKGRGKREGWERSVSIDIQRRCGKGERMDFPVLIANSIRTRRTRRALVIQIFTREWASWAWTWLKKQS